MALIVSLVCLVCGWTYKKTGEMHQEREAEYTLQQGADWEELKAVDADLWLERDAYHRLEEAYRWMRRAVLWALLAGFLFWLYTLNSEEIWRRWPTDGHLY